jgi:tRNA/tmRNA/rRNA uracil-C5-methylase (TrmA/RlmC/RlmD family)
LLKKVLPKLEAGKTKIKELVQNSSSLSGEVYLIKLDGGQQTIISKETRESITDRKALEEIRAAIDRKIFGSNPREKKWVIYR